MADGGTIVIAGFSPSDKVPQVFGETKTGQGPVAAGSIPFILLLVGIMSTSVGVATPSTQLVPITSMADADLGFGAGSDFERKLVAKRNASPATTLPMLCASR